MVFYKCIYCQKGYNHKSNYKYHLKKIKKCEDYLNMQISKYKNYNKFELMTEYFKFIKNNVNTIDTNIQPSNIKNKVKMSNSNLNPIDNKINNTKNVKTNNIKTNNIQTNNIQNKITNTQNNINVQNNVQNNITHNIKLSPYNKIRYDYIEIDTVKQLFEVSGEALPAMTQLTFFNPNNKNNHVIFCTNLRDNQIQVYTKYKFSPDGWEIVDKKQFFEQMIETQLFTLEGLKEFNEEEGNPLEIKNYTGFNNLVKELDKNKAVKKEFVNKLNNLCYQNKSIVKKTREQISLLAKEKNKKLLHSQ
jgi:hypothetical protein